MQEFHLDHNLPARNQTLFLSEKAWSVTRISFEDSVRNSSFQRIDHDPFIILLTVICANSQFIYSCVKLYFISLCTAAPSPHKNRTSLSSIFLSGGSDCTQALFYSLAGVVRNMCCKHYASQLSAISRRFPYKVSTSKL